ncbi:MAG TPA: hypothetical protein VNG71_11745 [Pyrinomonadaceae bacterium]|nr:hypothetical protein [Pyrinomonadaceae bacterium]
MNTAINAVPSNFFMILTVSKLITVILSNGLPDGALERNHVWSQTPGTARQRRLLRRIVPEQRRTQVADVSPKAECMTGIVITVVTILHMPTSIYTAQLVVLHTLTILATAASARKRETVGPFVFLTNSYAIATAVRTLRILATTAIRTTRHALQMNVVLAFAIP